jgi:hypothetical protein
MASLGRGDKPEHIFPRYINTSHTPFSSDQLYPLPPKGDSKSPFSSTRHATLMLAMVVYRVTHPIFTGNLILHDVRHVAYIYFLFLIASDNLLDVIDLIQFAFSDIRARRAPRVAMHISRGGLACRLKYVNHRCSFELQLICLIVLATFMFSVVVDTVTQLSMGF